MLKSIFTATAVLALSTAMSNAQDLSAMSWDEIVAQAQQEGELTWYVWYLQDDLRRAGPLAFDFSGLEEKAPQTSSVCWSIAAAMR